MAGCVVTADLARWGPAGSETAPSLAEAQAYCRRLARGHYENFSVLSWFVPRAMRDPIAAIYAWCRWADDLADEMASPAESRELLAWWTAQLEACYAGEARHPVYVALADTIRRHDLPPESFRDLLVAFRQDQEQTRYATAADLAGYCRRSANPVGRLLLHLASCHTPEAAVLSDHICTGLQWINFCQDVARDFARGRIYLPQETWQRHGVAERDLAASSASLAFRQALAEEVARAETSLQTGAPLANLAPPWLRPPVHLFTHAGLALAQQIRRQHHDVLHHRPTVSGWTKRRLMARFVWQFIAGFSSKQDV